LSVLHQQVKAPIGGAARPGYVDRILKGEVAGRRIEVLTAFFIDEIEMQNVIPMMVQRYQEQRLGD
jgi:hypothetical protein